MGLGTIGAILGIISGVKSLAGSGDNSGIYTMDTNTRKIGDLGSKGASTMKKIGSGIEKFSNKAQTIAGLINALRGLTGSSSQPYNYMMQYNRRR